MPSALTASSTAHWWKTLSPISGAELGTAIVPLAVPAAEITCASVTAGAARISQPGAPGRASGNGEPW